MSYLIKEFSAGITHGWAFAHPIPIIDNLNDIYSLKKTFQLLLPKSRRNTTTTYPTHSFSMI